MTALFLSHMVFGNDGAAVLSSKPPVLRCQFSAAVDQSCPNSSESRPVDLPVSDWHFIVSMSYCPVLHQFVESFADLGEVGSEGAAGVVQFGQELWVGVMVEDVVDSPVGFGGEVAVDQLQQQIPAAGQEVLNHRLVEGKVHLQQSGDI